MSNTTLGLTQNGLIHPPPFVPESIQYEVITGSISYGVVGDVSDFDINGFCIPPKNLVFPHLAGEINGFGTKARRFHQYSQHHIYDPSAQGGKGREYDVTIYTIVKFFDLCMGNNPNMLDLLFTPRDCVLFSTKIGEMVRSNREIFVHKGCFHKFRGFAFSQLTKMNNLKGKAGTRLALIEKYGYDVKYAYHLIRLVLEVEQLLKFGSMDLRQDSKFLKAIRGGAWTLEEVNKWFSNKEQVLEKLYDESGLPERPDEGKIKALLFNCLEQYYGSLEGCVLQEDYLNDILQEMHTLIHRTIKGGE